jgi:hypothetical protein
MTSFEMDILVRERIRDRLRKAELARLGRLAVQAPGGLPAAAAWSAIRAPGGAGLARRLTTPGRGMTAERSRERQDD